MRQIHGLREENRKVTSRMAENEFKKLTLC